MIDAVAYLGRTEQEKQSRKQGTDRDLPAIAQSQEEVAWPLQIPGVRYRLVNLTGSGLKKYLVSQLSWYSYL